MIDNRGLSTIVVHSKKGLNIVEDISRGLKIVETDFNKALENNENMYSCAKANSLRGFFLLGMRVLNPRLMFKVFGSNFYSKLRRKFKKILKG